MRLGMTGILVSAVTAVVLTASLQAQGRGGGSTPPPSGTAALRTASGDAISGSSYTGTFSDGRFSFVGNVCFTFGPDLGVLTPPTFSNPPGPSEGCYDTTFTTLGTGILSMPAGATQVRSVRFTWQGATKNDPSYGVHFRGDAILDGQTEMSKAKVTCDAEAPDGACGSWTLVPCEFDNDGPCTAADAPVDDSGNPLNAPVGQVYGTFPKGKGTTHISRHVMPWGMTIQR